MSEPISDEELARIRGGETKTYRPAVEHDLRRVANELHEARSTIDMLRAILLRVDPTWVPVPAEPNQGNDEVPVEPGEGVCVQFLFSWGDVDNVTGCGVTYPNKSHTHWRIAPCHLLPEEQATPAQARPIAAVAVR